MLAADSPHRSRARHSGDEIARAALGVLLDSRSLTDIVIRSVDLGGDTDTVAAIAMAPASVSAELARDLPVALIDGLEDGAFGSAYLAEMDSRLAAAFDAPIVAAGLRCCAPLPHAGF